MFDIGFSEMVVIGLVALIVIGPERLPRVARTLGHLVGRLQRYVADVKADINREVELDELRKMKDNLQQAATGFESSVQSEINAVQSDLNKAGSELNSAAAAAAAPATAAAGAAADPAPAAAEPPKLPEKTA
jgi:sec-independent protein translocase protein TatB